MQLCMLQLVHINGALLNLYCIHFSYLLFYGDLQFLLYTSGVTWHLPNCFWQQVFLLASKISKICLFGCPIGQATSWKANFENYFRCSLILWYQFLSIQYSMSNTSFRFRHLFLLSAHSSQSHFISCLTLMTHHQVNNKCNILKGQCWR